MPALNEVGSWVHSNLELNTLGRCLPQPPKMNEDGEEIEDPDAPEPSPVLRSIEEEEGAFWLACSAAGGGWLWCHCLCVCCAAVHGCRVAVRVLTRLRCLSVTGAWNVRQLPAAGRVEGAEGGLVVVRSLRWPGAASVGFGKRFANVYVGFGQRYAPAAYAPPAPADVQGEFDVTALAEEATFGEQADVTEDPDAGLPAGDGEGEEDDE